MSLNVLIKYFTGDIFLMDYDPKTKKKGRKGNERIKIKTKGML